MLATVHPEAAPTLLAQAQANQQPSGNAGGPVSVGYNQPVMSDASPDPILPGAQYAQAPLAQAQANRPASDNGGGVIQAGYRLGIPFPPMPTGPMPPGSFPVPSFPAPAIPDTWRYLGMALQLYPALVAQILNNEENPETPDPGDKPASTPIGRRGNPIDAKRGTNQPTTIGAEFIPDMLQIKCKDAEFLR